MKTTHVWAEEPGMQVLVEEDEHLRRIRIVDAAADADAGDVAVYTIALRGRQAAFGMAMLPDEDQRALRIGRSILAIANAIRGEG